MTVSPQHPGVTGCAWSHKIIRPTHEVAVSSGLKVKIQVEIKDIIGYKQFPPAKKVESMSCFQFSLDTSDLTRICAAKPTFQEDFGTSNSGDIYPLKALNCQRYPGNVNKW